MNPTILIIGCGNIGRRHIEALASAGYPMRVIGIEPDEAARAQAESLITPFLSGSQIVAHMDDLPQTVDLAVIATSAAHRRSVFDALLSRCTPKTVIFEKILFTTRADLDAVGKILTDRAIPAVVNCGRRGFPDYDRLRDTLTGRSGLSMEVKGAGWNLGSNAIHFMDLAEHVLADRVITLDESGLDPKAEPARIRGCVDLFGTLHGTLAGGGTITISQDRAPGDPLSITFSGNGESWRIEEGAKRLIHRNRAGEEQVEAFEPRFVSGMPYLYTEILDGKKSRLTPYEQSAAQHGLFLDAFRRRLGLSTVEDAPCPIS
ncbi:MAG: Gfo/Idh/MocA family oxidoreductase [Sphingobium sp.]